jgi:hypothetical protein
MLRDIDVKSITAPGVTDIITNPTFKASDNAGVITQTTASVSPQPTINQYIYQPIDGGGGLCTGVEECRKFNIYYRLEVPTITTDCPAPGYICMITSKNQ